MKYNATKKETCCEADATWISTVHPSARGFFSPPLGEPIVRTREIDMPIRGTMILATVVVRGQKVRHKKGDAIWWHWKDQKVLDMSSFV